MNIKSLFGLKATSDLSPELQKMAERVSTAAGCQSLAQELEQQRQAEPRGGPRASLLRRKLEELARLQKGHALAEDRMRAAAVVKRDQDAANKALKAAETNLKTTNEAATQAAAAVGADVAELDRFRRELAELHAAADKAVELARKGFTDAVASQGVNAQGEVAAFDALKKAQAHRATCGDLLAARIKAREFELGIFQKGLEARRIAARAAQDDLNLCRVQVARVEWDQAAQLAVDAYMKLRALRAADSAGNAFSLSVIHPLDVTFASVDRIANGKDLIGNSGRVVGWRLDEMAKTLLPADLTLLARQAEAEVPEPAASIPNPSDFVPGSNEYENALLAVERARVGHEQFEAARRAEQRPAPSMS